jgi:hypothetical protein
MQTSTTELIVIGVLSILWAAIGYRLSEGVRKLTGRTPWGLPSPVWALLWFLSVVLGLVLFLIARASDARRAVRMGPGHPEAPGESLGTRPIAPMAKPIRAGSQFPAYPRPANSPGLGEPEPSHLPPPPTPTPHAESGAPPVTASDPAPAAQGAPEARAQVLPPPGWHPDPSGRFHYRWWDGTMWTSQVSLSGQHLIDTNPDQRIGQY